MKKVKAMTLNFLGFSKKSKSDMMLRYFILMPYNNGKNTKFFKINDFDWLHVFLSHLHIMNIRKFGLGMLISRGTYKKCQLSLAHFMQSARLKPILNRDPNTESGISEIFWTRNVSILD
jgi:hypothetical protein